MQALRELGLEVPTGQFLTLIGPSGSGKSTLLRIIAGLEAPSSGIVEMNGRAVTDQAPHLRDVAIAFQEPALYPHMTVGDNIAFGLKVRRLSPAEIKTRVSEVSEILNITELIERKPAALSGGQRQRAAIARALALRPSLLLFDEPLSNLDPPVRLQMRLELAELHQRLGFTAIYVTHDQSEALALGQRVALLEDGAIRQIGTPEELYISPAHAAVAQFIGAPPMNMVAGRLSRDSAGRCYFDEKSGHAGELRPGRLPMDDWKDQFDRLTGRALILGIRPEWITLDSATGSEGWQVMVTRVEYLGSESWVHLQTASHRLMARVPPETEMRSGMSLVARVDSRRAQMFDEATGDNLNGRQSP